MLSNNSRRMGAISFRTSQPRVDSPTYLRITGRITEQEYQEKLEERRRRIVQPAPQRERRAAG